MIGLVGKTVEELMTEWQLSPPFRAKQLFKNIYAGVAVDDMSDLPKALRAALNEKGALFTSEVLKERVSTDGTMKLALRFPDDSVIETVALTTDKGRRTACLSTQVGCAMGCRFCHTALGGLKRNLTAAEIVEEFIRIRERNGLISHIVFMGMGEPLCNLDQVYKAIRILCDKDCCNLSKRKITVSTCGVVPGILRMAEEKMPMKLAVSLNAPDNEKRSRLMPINRKYPLEELKRALLLYQEALERRITFEYVLIDSFNDSEKDLENLCRFLHGFHQPLVNLIPWNPTPALEFKSPSGNRVHRFMDAAAAKGINMTLRRSRGRDIEGACGQLAGKAAVR